MIYLLLSILSSTCLFLIFKQFKKFGINNFQAIVANYVTAAICALVANDGNIEAIHSDSTAWIWIAIVTGILFIAMFNVIAVTTQQLGVSIATVSTKVSLIVPVVFAVFLYGDSLNALKIIGISLSLLSVYLTFYKPKSQEKISRKRIAFPIILFLGTGFLDTILKYTQEKVISPEEFNMFSAILFAVAGIIGFIVAAVNMLVYKSKFSLKSLFAGIVLGLPNYGSIYFLLQAFEHSGLESSVIFPINNISIVVVSVLAAILFFREKISKANALGILMAVLSIALISFA